MLRVILFLFVLTSSSAEAQRIEDGAQAAMSGDYAKALEIWTLFADRGDSVAQYNLGLLYYYGSGVIKDDTKAMYWYRKAAEQDYAEAQYQLATMYETGTGVLVSNQTAIGWYRKAAAQDLVPAQDALKRLQGVPLPNYSFLVQEIKELSKLNLESSQPDQSSGNATQNGQLADTSYTPPIDKSTPELNERTVEYHSQRVQIVDVVEEPPAQGGADPVPVPVPVPFPFPFKPIDLSDPDILYNIGKQHMNGEGVSINYLQAYLWFTLAQQHGNEDAVKRKAIIQMILPDRKYREAQRLVREFNSKH
ncbi:MAG: hypothetical protein ACI8P9_001360 [Parasphingorhabdus sp.]|jgi:hypothetical protein